MVRYFVATFIAIGGRCATNYKIFQDTIPLFVLAAFAEIILLALIKYANSKIKLILKEIRDLKKIGVCMLGYILVAIFVFGLIFIGYSALNSININEN